MEKSLYSSSSKNKVLEINNVLKNTYLLLGATVAFSALMAWIAMLMNISFVNPIIVLVVYFILLFAVNKTANSSMGIFFTFAFTGWLGFTLGPILNAYTHIPNGTMIIAEALGGTGVLFFALSIYTLTNKTNMSRWLPFMTIGILVAFVVSLLNVFFFHMAILSTIISAAFLIFSSMLLMWQTERVVNGGETNYILATITIYVALYNIFVSLLSLLGNNR